MSEDLWVGVLAGVVGTVVGGILLNGIAKQQRRHCFLKMLRGELKNFQGHLKLKPLKRPRQYFTVSTVNATLLEQALLSDVWDYLFDTDTIAQLSELVETVKRYNAKVGVVNSFTYGAAFGQPENSDEFKARKVLTDQLQAELLEISDALDKSSAHLDRILSAPAFSLTASTWSRFSRGKDTGHSG